jgi:hypothetical protein
MSLLVSTPTLSFEPFEALPTFPKPIPLEKPIKVRCGVVTFPDGKIFEQSQQATAGFFVYRQQAGATEIWNETTKLWVADPGIVLDSFKSKALAYQPSDPEPWQGLLLPAIEQDTAFKSRAGYDYFIRTYFVSNSSTGSVRGLSPPSSLMRFISLTDSLLAGIKLPNGKTAESTDEIQLFLRNSNLQIIGSVKITSSSSSAQIEIENQDTGGNPLAIVRLLPNGDIILKPSASGRVRVDGLLETEKIVYQPAGGGVKKTLA